MARIRNDEAEKFVPSSSGEWFALKNDGDTEKVQFLISDTGELDVFTVHKVKLGDKERYVNCIREYGEPLDVCPLCDNEYPLKVARFVVMYSHKDNKIKIWERGKQFISRLEGLANRYYPLHNTVFEIERHGKAGDKQTTYEIYPCPQDKPIDISDIERPELLGTIVLDKTAQDMNYFLDNGNFADDSDTVETPVRRRNSVDSNTNNAPVSRRSRRG